MIFLTHEDHTLFSKCLHKGVNDKDNNWQWISCDIRFNKHRIKLLSKFKTNGNQSETLDLGCTSRDCISAVYILFFFWHRFSPKSTKKTISEPVGIKISNLHSHYKNLILNILLCILWKLLDLLIQNTYSNKVETMYIFQTKEYFLISRLNNQLYV